MAQTQRGVDFVYEVNGLTRVPHSLRTTFDTINTLVMMHRAYGAWMLCVCSLGSEGACTIGKCVRSS